MIYIISDDLTGANDTGIQYTKQGFRTLVTVKTDVEFLETTSKSYDVISINVDTRSKLPDDAYHTVYDLVKKFENTGVDYIYKKIDSIVRGNPGVELDAVMDASNAKIALVATSFPEVGRKLMNGKLELIDWEGNKSVIDVIELFTDDMKRKVRGINLSTVKEGISSIVEVVERGTSEGVEVFVIDAESDEDLAVIKGAATSLKVPPVLCGSAGLAKQLSLSGREIFNKKSNEVTQIEDKATLILIGSRNNITSQQLKVLEEEMRIPVLTLMTGEVLNGGREAIIENTRGEVSSLIDNGCRLLAIVVDTLFQGFTVQLKDSEAALMDSNYIAHAIGELAKLIYETNSIDTIVSSGGDTSQKLLDALNAKGIHLESEILSGIPVGRVIDGIADGMTIVTKSGGFGDQDSLIKVIEYLEDRKNKLAYA
ncbi:type III effector Hrp-dependent outers [Alkaliphilus metalliredigens QYMF]|uniref:Type III effector Hrp-dependent outers n=1 Tax=Alkaliphilus metalliredigens (strain QYMF) TaxID=293826 RepID=A6TJU3_ALKMQ|nr:four-carbon acid sugar kinase family protein [Alkaliphilus metalliredigens]ABR46461.1 type III effector Hrp-dependent outers [Alkaliphilus metalliredigens QYMF]